MIGTVLGIGMALALIVGEILACRSGDAENDQRIDLGWKPKRRKR